jgi:ERCC4-type nuclease
MHYRFSIHKIIMLSHIPNISSASANAIIEKFGSIKLLMNALQENTSATT